MCQFLKNGSANNFCGQPPVFLSVSKADWVLYLFDLSVVKVIVKNSFDEAAALQFDLDSPQTIGLYKKQPGEAPLPGFDVFLYTIRK